MLFICKQKPKHILANMFNKALIASGLLFVLLFVAACGGGSSVSTGNNGVQPHLGENTFSGVAQKGPFVVDSQVIIRQMAFNGPLRK